MPVSNPDKYIAILDVGHGNSTVIRDGDNVIVIDCGYKGAGLIEFLKQEKIAVVKSLYLSHADQDHIGGVIGLIASDEIDVAQVIVNADASKETDLWDDLSYELSLHNEKGKGQFSIGISRHPKPVMCGDIEVYTVGPTSYLAAKGAGGTDRIGRVITSNSISASFLICWKGMSLVYLAGDIDQVSLDDLVNHDAALKADVLVYPHHGGNSGSNIEAFTDQLCKLVSPKTVIFSIGRNRFKNPNPRVVAQVRKSIDGVRISCTQLSLHCVKKLRAEALTHLTPFYARGRETFESCGGTFIIQLGEAIEHSPGLEGHQKFIAAVTHTSLCLH
jgi:beta-lactamase superfamily II metal-dependent hydrolase